MLHIITITLEGVRSDVQMYQTLIRYKTQYKTNRSHFYYLTIVARNHAINFPAVGLACFARA